MRNLEVEGVISEKSASRFVQTRFGDAAVSTAILKDETGSIILNLWRDQIEQVKEGDTVRITNAFAKTFAARNELSVGKDGVIQITRKVT